MRKRKIRGHRRRWKQIERWEKFNQNIDLDILKKHGRDYTKIRIHPWGGINITNSVYAEPKGLTKQKMLNGLFNIYHHWKNQLDKFGEPYSLKIWLYDNRFSHSQVVCAVGDFIDVYRNTFNKCEKKELINPNTYSVMAKEYIEIFSWECHLDEDYLNDSELGQPEEYDSMEEYLDFKKWFDDSLKKKHKVFKYNMPDGKITESYIFERGKVWIGERRK